MRALAVCLFFCIQTFPASAQCPPNIDFEQGNFTGWQCWLGTTYVINGKNIIDLSPVTDPVPGRHTMLSAFPPTGAVDQYGGFKVNCPNGSGYSIKLGDNTITTPITRAQGVSYTFTIPPGQNEYNFIYHYAVILHLPQHPDEQKPRFVITVENITDGTTLPCPLDPFIPNNNLPGFFDSPVNPDVKCKSWAAHSIKLDGLAGKTIRIFFKTATCTPAGHFGYAYIDINSECSSSFTGAVFCPDDAFINVTAPYGYQSYKWWNATDPTTILATTQIINFTPPPTPGTVLKVAVTPWAGYGCNDTLTAVLLDTLTIQSQAGPDQLSCNNAPVQLGAIPKAGYVYSWTPTTGLSNPNISNPVATPSVTTQYILTTTNAGGGCASRDTVIVSAAVLDNSLQIIGPTALCPNSTQTTILQVLPADSIQWYLDGIAIPGATQTQYTVLQTGAYRATLFSFTGCSLNTATQIITVYPEPVAGFTINSIDQCFRNHQYIFTNTSAVPAGTLQYDWDLGDGTLATTANVNHSYTTIGTYTVQLIVTTDNGCKDTSSFIVHVYESPVAGFNVNAASQCSRNNQYVFTNTSSIPSGTVQYAWNLGDGTTATTTNVNHSYTLPGTYTVKLIVTSDKGCLDSSSFIVDVFASPVAGFTVDKTEQCFRGNQFVFTNSSSVSTGTLQYDWNMGDGNSLTTRDVTYSYAQPGTYTVKLVITTNKGCKDSSSFTVIVDPQPAAGFTVNTAQQCFTNNQFVFNNTSNILWGTMQYTWDLGDGISTTTTNVTHSYSLPREYTVKLLVISDKGCDDDSSIIVTTYPLANADFTVAVQPVCINMDLAIINKTVNNVYNNIVYLWDFGNGQTATGRNPVYSYPAPGTYTIRLSVHLPNCPLVVTTKQMTMAIDAPVPGIRYPDKTAIYNFPEQLLARPIGTSVIWKPATSLDNRTSYNPVFKGINTQLYTIELKTPVGCVTVDTQLVKTLKKIEIYVPTAFSPGSSNGLNDLLRPLLYGFVKVNYFRVFDRWGKLLFQMQSDRPGWDGKVKGKPQEMQTVVWMIEAIDVDGIVHKRQGTTVLLR